MKLIKIKTKFIKLITVIIVSISSLINSNTYASNNNNNNNNNSIEIYNPWIRSTIAKQKTSGIFFSIKSNQNLILFKASIDKNIADRIEIHKVEFKNNTMHMYEVEKLELPKDKEIKLNHDYHLMIFGLKQKLQVGSKVNVTLYFKDENQNIIKKTISANIKPIYFSDKL